MARLAELDDLRTVQLVNAKRLGDACGVLVGDAASWQDDQASRCALDAGAELIEIVLDRGARGAAVREDVVAPRPARTSDRSSCSAGASSSNAIWNVMPKSRRASRHAARDLDEARRSICVKLEALAFGATLEAPDHDAVHAVAPA